MENSKSKSNIVLIGMPGCGKTTLGKILSEKLNIQFVDLDQKIEEKANKAIPDIFKEFGEQYFRKLENEVCKEVSKKNNQVISCGGGIVINENNMLNLKQNGLVVYITRDIDKLATNNRPLSKNIDALKEIKNIREPLYIKYSDLQVDNNEDINNAVNKIIEEIEKKGI